ncbi:MAG: ferrous iron transport protein B [Candidatus Omnitrophica bacterium 4484_70.2]|nr:MAG: ferrous iron transport protein B [Candidatus Omnitrophica bacterium 4484_70.2]
MSYRIALAGNPNSGKTTVFNLLCGAREKIGNWSGTTVEKKQGYFTHQNEKVEVVDLPGTYSLSVYSLDERIARDFLIKEKPDLVVCVVDASNLERNLYLVIQLLEMGQPVLLDLNMMDMVEKSKIKIDTQKLSRILGIDIVETVASKGKGLRELKEKIVGNLRRKERKIFRIDYHSLEKTIEEIASLLKDKKILSIPPRGAGVRILEQDFELLNKVKEAIPQIEKIKEKAETEITRLIGEDLETFIIEKRYAFLRGVIKECVKKEVSLEARLTFSDKLDKVLTNRILGIPLFLFFMYLLFQLVFTLGTPLADLVDGFFGKLTESAKLFFENQNLPAWLGSLVSDGIISGVGSVLVFLPNIMFLFLGISILEGSGYLARAAFVMDRFMHALGLHGKSFIPMLLGFGCNIPGIMATRTLESRKDRILTILINPLMSCSARLPVYTLFASAFFPKNQGLVVFSLYLLGIVLAIFVAKVFKHIFFKGEVAPLVMELPPYRIPIPRNVLLSMWTRSFLFIKKAGTVIFLAVVFIWLLSSLPLGAQYAGENSLIGKLGKILAPLFKPAGFGFWQVAVALLFGILAKEVVVGSLGTLYGASEEGLKEVLLQHFSPLSAYAFLIMTLIYIPCVAAIATIKRETNWKWTALAVSYSLILGWVLSVLFYQIGRFFGG